MDVLIADKGGKIGWAVARSLRQHGLTVEVFDDSLVTNDHPGYIRNLKRLVRECRPRMILPIFKSAWVAQHRDELIEAAVGPADAVPAAAESECAGPVVGSVIPVAEAEVLEMLDDKVRCSGLAASLGIEQPRMYADDRLAAITDWPVVYKRANGLSGSSVYFPKSMPALEKLVRSSAKPHLVMDYVDGYDLSVDMVRWPLADGTVYMQAVAYRVLWPRRKGISRVRIGVSAPDVIARAEQILDAVDYRGVCGMDFRVD